MEAYICISFFLVAALLLEGRFLYLQIIEKDFLIDQGDQRQVRTVPIPTNRASILDRIGEPLAVSTPVDSIVANPNELPTELEKFRLLGFILGFSIIILRYNVF